jgi:hypothetical protein
MDMHVYCWCSCCCGTSQDAYSIYSLTDEDKQAILKLAKDPRIGEQE